jgi:hypothetical protein
MSTLVATGSPLRRTFTYRHGTLVDVLAGLMDHYRPTVIHTMDPDPDHQVHDAAHPQDNDQPGFSDHRDHTPTALFTWKAITQWVTSATVRDGTQPGFVTTAFRGYYNERWPHNLPPAVLAQKAGYLRDYGGSPRWACGNGAGCGDYEEAGDRPELSRKGWIRSTHYRYPVPPLRLATAPGGALEAYAVLGGQAVRWRETPVGSGRLGAPEGLGGTPLAPALSVVTDRAGTRLLFGLRFSSLEGQGGANTRDIVARTDHSPWRSLGAPDPHDSRRTGCPAALATPDGRIHLFVRNASRGLSTRVRDPHGHWGHWRDLGGAPIQDGLEPLLDTKGRIHVFAASDRTVHHWTQKTPGAPLHLQSSPWPTPADPPSAYEDPDTGLTLAYRRPADPLPALYGPPTPTALPAMTGYGPVTAVRAGHATGLLTRSDTGEPVFTWTSTPDDRLHSPTPAFPLGIPTGGTHPSHGALVAGLHPTATPWLWHVHTSPPDTGAI